MNNYEIETLLRRCPDVNTVFKGVYASDTLPYISEKSKTAQAFIVNTAKSYEAGEHWIAIYQPGGKNSMIEYFDSYGIPVFVPRIRDILGNLYLGNKNQIQSLFSAVCGQYSIFFLWKRCQGFLMQEIVRHFTSDPVFNDWYVNDMIEKHFQINLDIYDEQMINQTVGTMFECLMQEKLL